MSTSTDHSTCCADCIARLPAEDRSPQALRAKYGKPIYELAEEVEDNE